MSKIKGNVINFEKKDRIVVGLSGGPDSMALLDMLVKEQEKKNYSIIVVHVNHGLRNQSGYEELFLKNYCQELNIPFYSTRLNLENNTANIEEVARDSRYNYLKKIAQSEKCNIIVTAHHMNDQAETVILNLARGTGPAGLKGIAYESRQEEFTIIRPLLHSTKQEILNYCSENNIPYFNDHTNSQNNYSRNLVRNEIFPLLEKRFPKVQQKIVQASRLILEENKIIGNIIQYLLGQWINIKDGIIYFDSGLFNNLEAILEESNLSFLEKESYNYLLSELIRQALGQNQNLKDFSGTNIDQILAFFKNNKAGSIDLPNNLMAFVASGIYGIGFKERLQTHLGDYIVRNLKNKNREYYFSKEKLILKVRQGKLKDFRFPDKEEARILLKKDLLPENIRLRPRNNGDRIKLKGMEKDKKLNRFFIDRKIPSFLRDSIPVIASEKIIWIPTLYFDEKYRVSDPDEEVIELTLNKIN